VMFGRKGSYDSVPVEKAKELEKSPPVLLATLLTRFVFLGGRSRFYCWKLCTNIGIARVLRAREQMEGESFVKLMISVHRAQ